MPGAGSFSAGVGLAGVDPVGPLSERTVVTPITAAFFDPAVQDYPLGPNGQLVGVHPVDQAVALALSVPLGSVTSDPGFGNTFRSLPRGNRDKLATAARDAAQRALLFLIARGDVTLLDVVVTLPSRGVLVIEVRYRNNRLPPGAAPSEPIHVSI